MRLALRPADPDAARELGRACGVAPAVAQVLLHRGIDDERAAREFLSPQLSGLSPPDAMADRAVAAERLARAIRRRERIAVFGDYDVDGTTSAAIVSGILEELGGEVEVLVANRFEGGYGLSDAALSRVLAASPGVLLTCDCGSSDHERIERAQRAGVDVVVVDHHLVPDEPLPALAFLNPHRPQCGFPYKNLASAGLALLLGAALRKLLDQRTDLRSWLDLVALGTVADVAPLDGDNRRLVRAGLRLLGAVDARPGVSALREQARIKPGPYLGATDIAFRFAPRLNAAGRLADPGLTLSLLRARSLGEARQLAAEIERVNEQRKAIEQQTTREALQQVLDVYGERPEGGLVVAQQGWHRGVVGICAARLVERFGVPVVVVALDGELGHGSCRAPAGFRLFDATAACGEHLVRFGGHQAATGLTVRAERVERLRVEFADACRRLGMSDRGPVVHQVDVQLDGHVMPLPPALDLARLEPLGVANPEPLFLLSGVTVRGVSRVREQHLKLQLRLGDRPLTAFGYDMAEREVREGQDMTLLGTLRPDAWHGGEQVELRLVDLEP